MDQEIEIAGFSLDWAELSETIQTTGVEFAINLLAATAIFLAGRVVARLLTRGLRSLMQRQKADPILETFVCNLVYWALMAFVIIAAITKLGVQTASLIALIGAAGLAVGLAMQGSLANFAAGVLIVMFRPYRVGDWIEAAGIAGTVEEVQILTTTLKTADNKRITVPNGQIMDSIITNYSANSTRRIDLVVGVSYDDDIDKVRETLKELVQADERIHQDPSPQIVVAELADSSVNFYVRPWVATADYWPVRFDLTEKIKKRFDEVGIRIPYPQRDVHIIRQEA
jgi:small conductance mechanosensitive channel